MDWSGSDGDCRTGGDFSACEKNVDTCNDDTKVKSGGYHARKVSEVVDEINIHIEPGKENMAASDYLREKGYPEFVDMLKES